MTNPSITLTGINNTSIDNSPQQITGLNNGTTYNLQAIMTHTGTGKMTLVNQVKDDLNAVVEFTTTANEILSFTTDSLVKAFNQITLNFNFTSNSTSGYDLAFNLYHYTGGSFQFVRTQQENNILNGDTIPLSFTNLNAGSRYKVTVVFFNRRRQLYYNGGVEEVVFADESTNNYIITATIDTGSTTRNATSFTVFFDQLKDNSGSGVFSSIQFRATAPGKTTVYATLKTNVPFVNSGDSALEVRFVGLQHNTNYLISGLFVRTGIYSKDISTGFHVTTEEYFVTNQVYGLTPNTTSFQFGLSSLAPNGFSDNTGNFLAINVKFDTYLPTDLVNPVIPVTIYDNVPFFTTRTFTISGLQPDTSYVVKARFSKAGFYTDLVYDFFTESTISNILNADITVNNVSATTDTVSFDVVDFQSEFADSLHTVQIIAVRFAQMVMLQEGLVAYWLFQEYSLIDPIGNEIIPNGPYNNLEDPYYEVLEESGHALSWSPRDNTIFEELQGDFRFLINFKIPDSIGVNRFTCKFVNAYSYEGFIIKIDNNVVSFEGRTGGHNGDTTFTLFKALYTLPSSWVGQWRTLEFTYLNFGLDAVTKNFGIGKIFDHSSVGGDTTEVAFNYANNSTNQFGATTIGRGMYFITTNSPTNNNHLDIFTPVMNTQISRIKIGSETRTLY